MQTEINFDYSPQLARKIARRFYFKNAISRYVGLIVLGICSIFTALIGVHSWFQGVPIALLVIEIAWWIGVERRAVSFAQDMEDKRVTVQFDDENITFETTEGKSIIKWSRIKQVIKMPEAWLLFTHKNADYSLIPIQSLSEELQTFIEQSVTVHGGYVK